MFSVLTNVIETDYEEESILWRESEKYKGHIIWKQIFLLCAWNYVTGRVIYKLHVPELTANSVGVIIRTLQPQNLTYDLVDSTPVSPQNS